MGRYVSSNKAIYTIRNCKIHEHHPIVVHLSIRLENGQTVYFMTENAVERTKTAYDTTLTVFFRLCTQDDSHAPFSITKFTLHLARLKHNMEQAKSKKCCARTNRNIFTDALDNI